MGMHDVAQHVEHDEHHVGIRDAAQHVGPDDYHVGTPDTAQHVEPDKYYTDTFGSAQHLKPNNTTAHGFNAHTASRREPLRALEPAHGPATAVGGQA
eukprot:433811-Alexandrium_andersonii.AAC.1